MQHNFESIQLYRNYKSFNKIEYNFVFLLTYVKVINFLSALWENVYITKKILYRIQIFVSYFIDENLFTKVILSIIILSELYISHFSTRHLKIERILKILDFINQ